MNWANGTALEGDWDAVFECVRKCHEKIHAKGALEFIQQ